MCVPDKDTCTHNTSAHCKYTNQHSHRDMDTMAKRAMVLPIKKLSICVTEEIEREGWAKRVKRRTAGVKTHHLRWRHTKGPPVVSSYQADLEKERKLREALNAQKNAERSAMRAHFRKKYQLSKSSKDTIHLNNIGGKVALPQELTKIIHPETPAKDDGYSLLNAIQGLSFNIGVFGGKTSKAAIPASTNGEPCKVM